MYDKGFKIQFTKNEIWSQLANVIILDVYLKGLLIQMKTASTDSLGINTWENKRQTDMFHWFFLNLNNSGRK